MPHLFELNEEYASAIWDTEQSALYYITEDAAQRTSKVSNFAQAADAIQGKIYFVTTDITSNNGQHIGQLMGLTKAELPIMAVLTPTQHGAIKYRYSGIADQASKEAIIAFATDFLNNKLTPFHKSEPVPKEQGPAGSVVQVVRSTWHSIVLNPEHDVFVLFYNP